MTDTVHRFLVSLLTPRFNAQFLHYVLLLSGILLLFIALNDNTVVRHRSERSPQQLGQQYGVQQRVPIEQYTPGYKVILLWTKWFGNPTWNYHLGKRSLEQNYCPEQRCFVTNNRLRASEASLVLFHARDININDMPQQHPHMQRWVFNTHESPVHSFQSDGILGIPTGLNSTDFDGLFNMTSTFMPESDIYGPYGRYMPRKSNISHGISEINSISSKTELILWYVSNCQTEQTKWRKAYVQELQQFVPIDIFGACGKSDPCKSSSDVQSCTKEMFHKYKFYLAFENCLCRQYVTEKFWRALHFGTLPIVLGSPMEDMISLAPPDSFIHVDNFTSSQELAKYIQYLDSNNEAYNKYQKWRDHYELGSTPEHNTLCQLCKAAHEANIQPKTYKISQWFNPRTLCKFV